MKSIRRLDILDYNGGDHGQAFATDFNPEINIREVTAPDLLENGEFVKTPAMGKKANSTSGEAVGPKNVYMNVSRGARKPRQGQPRDGAGALLDDLRHEYIKHLTVLQKVGMTRIAPVKYQGKEIIPLQFLAAVLPKPGAGRNHQGRHQYPG